MKHGLFVAPFGELADPGLLSDVAVEAERGGCGGVFLWVRTSTGEFAGAPEVARVAAAGPPE